MNKKRSKYRCFNGNLIWEYKIIIKDQWNFKTKKEYYFGSTEKDLVKKPELIYSECPYYIDTNEVFALEEVWE
jgi:hypothetical protein